MIGQLSNIEFKKLYEKAGTLRRGHNLLTKQAWIMYGVRTVNYYIQHEDGSWTNYNCKTLDS